VLCNGKRWNRFPAIVLRPQASMLLRYLKVHKLSAVLIENVLLVGYVLLGPNGRYADPSEPYLHLASLGRAFVFITAFQALMHLLSVYDFRVKLSWSVFLRRLVQGILLACAVTSLLHITVPSLLPASSGLPALLIGVSITLMLWRVLLRLYFKFFTRRSSVLILGTGRLARELAAEIVHRPELGLAVTGFLDDDPNLLGVSIVNPRVIGSNKELTRIVSECKVDKVVVEIQDRRGRLPFKELLELKTSGIGIEEATTLYERLTGKIAVENLKASWMIFGNGFDVSSRALLLTRILSILVSMALLVLFLPIFPLIALLIKLDSRGPVLHRQERVGQHGKIFVLWKYRSMRHDAEQHTGPVWAARFDKRVTRVGKFLRRTRLDEVPQLYNVLRGDMNLVGPRPERPQFVQELSKTVPFYHLRHSVKPGVTGWAQINYRYGNSVEDAVEKLQYDLFYVKNMSLLFDVVVILDTVKTVLVRKGS
jgi:sugar transferase (PEP-CTERM system associated)